MPPVPNETIDEPAKLGVYDFSDGARLKMTAADAARYQEGLDKAAADRSAWEAVNRGDAPAATDELTEVVVPLTILTKAELVKLAEKRGLATSGSKSTIAARFVDGADGDEPEADEPEAEADPGAEPDAG